MITLQVYKTLKKCEMELEELLNNAMPMVTVDGKCNQDHLSDALTAVHIAQIALLKVHIWSGSNSTK